MKTLTRWDPFQEMEDLQNRLSNFFGRALVRRGDNKEESITMAEWSPLVDIIEDDKEYLIKAELPEIKKEDVKVRVENGLLTISGERSFEREEQSKKYHRVERSYGSFARSFVVLEDADAEKVNAEFKDGVLKVHLAKSEKAKPKQIEVQGSQFCSRITVRAGWFRPAKPELSTLQHWRSLGFFYIKPASLSQVRHHAAIRL